MTFRKYVRSLSEAIRTAGMFLMLIAGSLILGHFIAVTNIPQNIADYLVTLQVNRYVILLLICLVYELGGTFIEDLAFMILATPIFFPTVIKLGFDPVWFGILISVVVMVGMIIPPVAIAVFVVKNITKVPTITIYKGSAPFLIGLILFLGLLFAFPQLALWLPSLFIQ
jgi:TRAP-type C4-dicarboxylate transport system permease large subunit